MRRKRQFQNSLSATIWDLAMLAMSLAIVFILAILATTAAQAQTYTVIHNFTGGADGANPYAGVTIDAAGNIYGAASAGATLGGECYPIGCGTVFRLKHAGLGWVFSPLYSFPSWTYGHSPYGALIRDAGGDIYGTTALGGTGAGTVFKLTPLPAVPVAANAPWTESVLYHFSGGTDGKNPYAGVTLDQAGNLYGTTSYGGGGSGTVFKLTLSGGGWAESVLHTFTGGNDGAEPYAGVVLDEAGNLYGTTPYGGAYGCGVVFQLTPSGSSWNENVLYDFSMDGNGCNPLQGVIFDQAGNLYGTTTMASGNENYATIFELSPSNGSWNFSLLYVVPFPTLPGYTCYEASAPAGSLTMDSAGDLYGTMQGAGEYGFGSVFKLTRSNGGWTYTTLHDFNITDDWLPCGGVTLDANGNLYGTTVYGGSDGNEDGVVFQITP